MADNPFATPQATLETSPAPTDVSATKEIADSQRFLLYAVLFGIVANVVPFLLLVSIPAQIYCVWRLAKALGMGTGSVVLVCLLQFIPLVNLITLLVVNGNATKELKAAGLRVGLLGVSKADIDRL